MLQIETARCGSDEVIIMRSLTIGLALAVLSCGASNGVDDGSSAQSGGGNGGSSPAVTGGTQISDDTGGGFVASSGGAAGESARGPDAGGVARGGGGNGGIMGNGGSAGAAGHAGAVDAGSVKTPDDAATAHTVGKCDGLGAVGTWVSITPPYIAAHPTYTGALVALASRQTSGIVYVTSDTDGVFKSTDCGATWNKVNTGRNASQLSSGRIWSAVIDPVAPDTLYALTGYGATGLWKTTNGGVDWDQTLPPGSEVATTAGGFTERVAMDPTDHLHLLVNFHQNCTGGRTPVCFGESTDGGTTWNVIDHGPGNGWAEGSGMFMLSRKVWIYGAAFGGIYRTADGGGTWTSVTPSGAGGANFPGGSAAFQSPSGSYFIGSLQGVLTSQDGATWSLIPNSGSKLTPVIGDGNRLFAGMQFDGTTNVWVASYQNTTQWTALATPGFPDHPSQGIYTFDYDPDHHLLYTTSQSQGIYRVVTK